MNRWLVGLVAFLLTLPILVVATAGGIALWLSGWYFYVWWLLPICWGLAFLILRNVRKKRVAKLEATRVWTPRDDAAWKIVDEEAKKAAQWPEDKLAVADTYVATVRELAVKLARHYHLDAADPIEQLTLIEIFTAIELAGRDMAELVRDPACAGESSLDRCRSGLPAPVARSEVVQLRHQRNVGRVGGLQSDLDRRALSRFADRRHPFRQRVARQRHRLVLHVVRAADRAASHRAQQRPTPGRRRSLARAAGSGNPERRPHEKPRPASPHAGTARADGRPRRPGQGGASRAW